ncbi:TetR family transcriptional regulator [Mesorhizobium erdmanii]|uniref:TetR/AcrR family transcriptional regulator n=2 Tax=Mesorhizobium TaxID=68287 RepID=A0A3M9XHE3_9HYPH|nr:MULTISPECIES: TetR/AcrR family transcriptional regulator [Mesorhizobium]RNJ47245.1 TetR/AcrR family transcriptional regulator [Mesorhizobium japonicum]RXT40313.1 TetR family transcriptional regulator [Mesorhizobium erdmanii]
MRVSKEKASANRDALLKAASRLFRQRGIEGVGVAEIAKEAGLTHGALYAHFSSKDELAAAAFSYGFAGNMADTRAWAGDRNPSFQDYMGGLLSPFMRDKLETGCPMAASASEIGRQDCGVSASFTDAFQEMAAMLEGSIETIIPAAEKRKLAIAAVAAEIGAMAVSRAIAKTDVALADEVLQAVLETIAAAYRGSRRIG